MAVVEGPPTPPPPGYEYVPSADGGPPVLVPVPATATGANYGEPAPELPEPAPYVLVSAGPPAGPGAAFGLSAIAPDGTDLTSVTSDAALGGSGLQPGQSAVDQAAPVVAFPAPPGPALSDLLPQAAVDPTAPTSTTVTTSADVTAESPDTMAARIEESAETSGRVAYERDRDRYDAQVDAREKEAEGLAVRAADLENQRLEQAALVAEQQRTIQAMEQNPIDEDAYWTTGRKVAGFIALALAGFLQGFSGGRNPALNQMMSAFRQGQADWMANQRAERDSTLKRRAAIMNDARAAEASLKSQLGDVFERYITNQAALAGVPPPLALTQAIDLARAESTEALNQVGQLTVERAGRSVTYTQPQRQAPARRADAVLAHLGLDAKAIDEAWDPKRGNVPGAVQAADRLAEIQAELAEIQDRHGDSLPQQNLVSYSTIGAAGIAARLDSDSAEDELRAKALILEATQMLKQASGTTKLFDSNQEREDLIQQLNTGQADTTMQAMATIAQRAADTAFYAAQRYTRDPEALLQFVRDSRRGAPAAADAGQASPPAAQQPPGGAGAEAPLAPAAATGSRSGAYRALRSLKPGGLP